MNIPKEKQTTKIIIRAYLEANGYDGLYNAPKGCYCDVKNEDDFCCCDDVPADCMPGYRHHCVTCTDKCKLFGSIMLCMEEPGKEKESELMHYPGSCIKEKKQEAPRHSANTTALQRGIEEGCKYCSETNNMIREEEDNRSETSFSLHVDGYLTILTPDRHGFLDVITTKISFCPFCGRKIGVENERN